MGEGMIVAIIVLVVTYFPGYFLGQLMRGGVARIDTRGLRITASVLAAVLAMTIATLIVASVIQQPGAIMSGAVGAANAGILVGLLGRKWNAGRKKDLLT